MSNKTVDVFEFPDHTDGRDGGRQITVEVATNDGDVIMRMNREPKDGQPAVEAQLTTAEASKLAAAIVMAIAQAKNA
jgi:hypothetical protein